MKVRVILTLDVDEEEFRSRYSLIVAREGGVRDAVRTFIHADVQMSPLVRVGAVRSVTLKES
ncbi:MULTISPECIES: hypothetical protein [unclassified Streptomyces]|uniref:hypothetical protein n=1 Tax=unclassified Streptomyces TaxID=2593676 RepID=UPI0033DA3B34